MQEEHAFNWIDFVPGFNQIPNHIAMAIIIGALLVVVTFFARAQLVREMRTPEGALVPPAKLTFRNFFEIVAEAIYGLTESILGHHDAPIYFPVIGSLFVFIAVSNLVGLIPGLLPPTDNLNTTLALGVFVFIYYNIAGLKAHGLVGYIKHFMGPIWYLAPLFFCIEVVGHIFRPLSLSLRLRGNVMGDHIVIHVFSGLVPYIVPVIFYGLGVFVAFIQAFVFCLMTMIYISLSTAHDH